MTDTSSQPPNILNPMPRKKNHTKTIVIISAIGALILCVLGGGLVYGHSFKGRVLPGVHIGSFEIGGMSEIELAKFVDDMHAKLLTAGIPVTFEAPTSSGHFLLYPQSIGNDAVNEFITIDSNTVAHTLVSYHKSNNFFLDSLSALRSLVTKPSVAITDIIYQKEKIFEELEHSIQAYITLPVNARVHVKSLAPLTYDITSSSRGVGFDYNNIFDEITEAWSHLEQPTVHIVAKETAPTVVEADVKSVITTLPQAFSAGPLTLFYTNSSTKRDYKWTITPTMIARWIEVAKDEQGHISFVLSASSTSAYLHTTVAPDIEVEPQDAKFKVGTDNKVAEFQGSHPGVTVDLDKTYKLLATTFAKRFESIASSSQIITLFTEEVEPNVKTEDVNDLGITEVLGVGTSVFRGSPGNRLKNIKLAAFKKLDGTLVKPGENFSLLNVLKPFTLEAGYLPELVIKGDKEEIEIGGGLCQIGTTLFRAAMNAGLEITERRNHSLMISYYYDPRNHNPGTDATIYDPGTDFRFLNDTGHYILITVDMNEANGDLFFTMWGTSDGRKGYFLPPTVSARYPAGPTRNVPTTDLAPGTKKCQPAFPGASASLTYVRELPTGEKKERVFTSYYRPLPEICLVGVEKKVDPVASSTDEQSILPENSTSQDGVSGDPTIEIPGFIEG